MLVRASEFRRYEGRDVRRKLLNATRWVLGGRANDVLAHHDNQPFVEDPVQCLPVEFVGLKRTGASYESHRRQVTSFPAASRVSSCFEES